MLNKISREQVEMIINALEIVLKNYCRTREDEKRYETLINHIYNQYATRKNDWPSL